MKVTFLDTFVQKIEECVKKVLKNYMKVMLV